MNLNHIIINIGVGTMLHTVSARSNKYILIYIGIVKTSEI